MKRYIATDKDNNITDICNEHTKRENCNIFLDEVESPANVWINNKCIHHESGLFNFKFVDGKIIENDNSEAIKLYNYNKELDYCMSMRRSEYIIADALKNELEFDGKDLKIWRDKVAETKSRYPKPVKP